MRHLRKSILFFVFFILFGVLASAIHAEIIFQDDFDSDIGWGSDQLSGFNCNLTETGWCCSCGASGLGNTSFSCGGRNI